MSRNRQSPLDAVEQLDLPTLPHGWCWARVHQLGDVTTGSTPSKQRAEYFGGSIPFIKPTDLNAGYYVRDYSDSLTDAGTTQARLLPERTVLVTCIGATIGKTGLSRVECATNQQINALATLPDTPLPEWCYWAFVSPHGQKQIKTNASATTLPILNKGKFERIPLPVAPLAEQGRIVAKIEELFSDLDAGVAVLKRAKANLKRYRAAVLKAAVEGKLTETWRDDHPDTEPASKLLDHILAERRQKWEADQLAKFAAAEKEPPKNWRDKYVGPSSPDMTELSELPKTWCWVSIEQLAANEDFAITDGPFGSNLKTVHYTDDGPRVIRLQNVGDGVFIDDDAHISPDHFSLLQRHSVKAGDVIIAMLGEILPRACLVPSHIPPAIVKADCVKVAPNCSIVLPTYLVIALNARPSRVRASTKIAGVGRPRLNLQKLRPLAIPLPPPDELAQIVSEVEATLSQAEAAELAIDHDLLRAARLRQSILMQAFEGKLVPHDPKDEPASVLLERIRASQSAHERTGKPATPVRTNRRQKISTTQLEERYE